MNRTIRRATKKKRVRPKSEQQNKTQAKTFSTELPPGIEGVVRATADLVKTQENELKTEQTGVCFINSKKKNTLHVPAKIAGKFEIITVSKTRPVGVDVPEPGNKIVFQIVRSNGHYEALITQVLKAPTATSKLVQEMHDTSYGQPIVLSLGYVLSILAREGKLLSTLPEDGVTGYLNNCVNTILAQKGFENYRNLQIENLVKYNGEQLIFGYVNVRTETTGDNGVMGTGEGDAVTA
jgi:hypothetical protein